MVLANVGFKDGVATTFKIEKYAAPNRTNFNYWTFWLENDSCRFLNSDQVDSVLIEEIEKDGD